MVVTYLLPIDCVLLITTSHTRYCSHYEQYSREVILVWANELDVSRLRLVKPYRDSSRAWSCSERIVPELVRSGKTQSMHNATRSNNPSP